MRAKEGFWQSFADLAMGTMAVIILILILVLAKQTEDDAAFRDALRDALIEGKEVEARQDRLAELIEAIFRESGCPLRFDPATGRLAAGTDGTANLYPEGSVELSIEGRDALARCGDNFLTLVVCFDRRDASGPVCRRLLELLGGSEATVERRFRDFQLLRGQVEAMVLEGNTDRSFFSRAPPIRGLTLPPAEDARRLHAQYISNAHLGTERARQAMAHLSAVVAEAATRADLALGEVDPLDTLFALLSVESPAFGRYLSGPADHRRPGCRDEDECSAARNLSLRLRWTEGSLRRPFDAIVAFYCDQVLRNQARGQYETDEGDVVICRGR